MTQSLDIKHHPKYDIHAIEKFYSDKDGVAVKYVCTSAPGSGAQAMDIFYRETPHPEFGNRYFGLYRHSEGHLMITNADVIENVEFGMIEGTAGWEYSQHRHDYRVVGHSAIDGGRAYVRQTGNLAVSTKTVKIINGRFVEND